MLINLRNALMAGKRLPYDAELEYLESTGTQWIDTGVKPTSDTQVEITYKQPAAQSNVTIFGSRAAYNDRSYCIWTNANGYIRFDYSPTGRYSNANGPSSVVGDFVVVKKNGRQNFVNGTEYTANTAATFTCVGNAYLFAINNNGTADFKLSAQISACKIYDANDTLVRDFIPVRKGTVGYLYDRVSGKLFGNAGTGDFVLGPDKN